MSIQEQLQRKRTPLDTWDSKEKHCLASVVMRNGEREQNWSAVSRLMKTVGHPTRPSDWYSPKNCAAQYGLLLETAETPKRKKRVSGVPNESVETPVQSIFRRVKEERIAELQKNMQETKLAYARLKQETEYVRSGRATPSEVIEFCRRIEMEKKQKEKEQQLQAKWMKEREEKKLEMEKQWRTKPVVVTPGQKRKATDIFDGSIEPEESHESKPAISPLLTSLLKSPSPAPTTNTSLLHTAIQQQQMGSQHTSPTIASLLGSSNSDLNIPPAIQLHHSPIHDNKLLQQVSSNVAPPILAVIENNLLSQSTVPHISVPPEEDTMQILEDIDEIIKGDVKIGDDSLLLTTELSHEKESKIAQYLELDKVEKAISQQNITQQALLLEKTNLVKSQKAEETAIKTVVQEIETISNTILKECGKTESTVKNDVDFKIKSETEVECPVVKEEILPDVVSPVKIEEEPEPLQNTATDVELVSTPKTVVDENDPVRTKTPELETISEVTNSSEQKEKTPELADPVVKISKTTPVKSCQNTDTPVKCPPAKDIVKQLTPEFKTEESETETIKPIKESPVTIDSSKASPKELVKEISKEIKESNRDANKTKVTKESKIFEDVVKNEDTNDENVPLSEFKNMDSIDETKEKHNVEEKPTEKVCDEPKSETTDGDDETEEANEAPCDTNIDPPLDSHADVSNAASATTENVQIMETEEDMQKTTSGDDSSDLYDVPIGVVKSDAIKRDYSRRKEQPLEEEIDIVLPPVKDDDKDADDETSQGISDESTQASDQTKFESSKNPLNKSRFDERSFESTDEENQTISTLAPIVSVAKRRQSSLQIDSKPNSPDCMSISSGNDDRSDVDTKEYRAWKKSIMFLYMNLMEYKSSTWFLKPITDEQAPGYSQMIKRPRDLSSLRKLVENGTIRTTDEFVAYVLSIVQNALMYNKMGSDIFQTAKDTQTEYINIIQRYVDAQASVETPLRLKTRTNAASDVKKTRVETPVSKRRKK